MIKVFQGMSLAGGGGILANGPKGLSHFQSCFLAFWQLFLRFSANGIF